MIPKLLERIFGANWRTTSLGLLESAVLLSGAYLLLPPEVTHNPVAIVFALGTALLKHFKENNIKDKQVMGTPGTGQVVAPEGEKPREIPATRKIE